MINNAWFKLAIVSLTGIVVSFLILWGIGQFNAYTGNRYVNNGNGYQQYSQQQNGMNMANGTMQNGMNMQGNQNMQNMSNQNMQGMSSQNMQGMSNQNMQGMSSQNMQGMSSQNMQGMSNQNMQSMQGSQNMPMGMGMMGSMPMGMGSMPMK